MGIASLVLGIIACLLSFIPGCGLILGILPALIGVILGIVALAKKSPKKGMAIAGLILSILSIIIMITVLLVIGGGALSALGEATDSLDTGTLDSVRESMNSISNSTTAENKEYKIGETHKDEDLSIKFISANEDFKGYSTYATIQEGYKILEAQFEVENLSDTNQYISSYKFNCYADDYDCDTFYSVNEGVLSATLSEGKKTKGAVYFEIPADASEITIEYDINSVTGEKAIFVVK